MKPIKPIFSFLIIMSILFEGSAPVLAQRSVIDPLAKGSITIQIIAVEDTDDYNTPGTGEEQEVGNLQSLSDIGFEITRVEDDSVNAATAISTTGDDAYTHTLTTNATGKVVFTNLEQGVYLIKELENSAVHKPVADFLVRIPTTNPSGTGWIYDVFVYPKIQLNEKPNMDLYINNTNNKYASLNLGDTVTWVITSEIPNDIATAKKYQVQNIQHEYLINNAASINVYARNVTNTTIPLELEADYIISESEEVLSIDILEAGKRKLAGVLNHDNNDFIPLMYVEYETTLAIPEDVLEQALASKIYNTAILNYTNSTSTSFVADMSNNTQPYVYTGGFRILSMDGRTQEYLSGASFELYNSLEDANALENAIEPPAGNIGWQVTTNEEGKAFFYGIAYSDEGIALEQGNKSYYLVETQAPVGYNLLGAPREVTINSISHLPDNEVVIRSNTGFTLPITGGMGTLLFTAVGLILIGMAIILFHTSRKKKKVNEE